MITNPTSGSFTVCIFKSSEQDFNGRLITKRPTPEAIKFKPRKDDEGKFFKVINFSLLQFNDL